MAVAFLLLVLFVQLGMVMTARNAAEAAVAASARRAARPAADLVAEQQALESLIRKTVPGAEGIEVEVRHEAGTARARASFTWIPPGPRWIPVVIRVESASPVVVPP